MRLLRLLLRLLPRLARGALALTGAFALPFALVVVVVVVVAGFLALVLVDPTGRPRFLTPVERMLVGGFG